MPRRQAPSCHPVVEQVQDLILRGRADEARDLVAHALIADPGHPDLIAAQGLILAYSGEEEAAAKLLRDCGTSSLAIRLQDILLNHFTARAKLAKRQKRKDDYAESFLQSRSANIDVRITACLIVKNEEKHLARCLKSIQGIVDEIIVVDTGSNDRTIEIAGSFGARVSQFEWRDDFAAARNESLKFATGEWILWIDADEELTPDSRSSVERAIVRPQFGGFAIEITNFTDDDSDDALYVHRPIRLFRNLPGIQFEGRIHEQIAPSIAAQKLPWAHLPGARLLHNGYRPSEMAERGKVDRTVKLIGKVLADNPTDAFQWFNLANAYTSANDFQACEQAARQCVQNLDQSDSMGALAYQLWSNALLKLNRPSEALKACDEADRKGFGGLLNEFERANALLSLGLLEEALEAANRCLALDWPADMTGDIGIADFKRYIVRGQILALKGEHGEAIAMFDRALRSNPSYGPAIYSRAATLEKAGELEKALTGFLAGQENPAVGPLCVKGAGRVCMSLGLPKRSFELYREAWRRDHHDEEAWVGWVTGAEASGEIPAIVEAYATYAEHSNPTSGMLVNWGRALDSMGDFDRAATCFREAIERDSENANAHFNLGDLYYKLEAFVEACESYQAGLKIEPGSANGWFVLGNALARLGLTSGAEVSYLQALAIRPDYREARLNLETICQKAA
jgi:tetratricopeptide (TPR) repeat protein